MTRLHHLSLSRRLFLSELGKGTLAVAVLGTGVAACSSGTGNDGASDSPGDDSGSSSSTSDATEPGASSTSQAAGTERDDDEKASGGAAGRDGLQWERVSFGFVSAYVLARGNEVAIVDTGTAGNADKITDALSALSFGWHDVDHVVVTHAHGDHVGGLDQVLTLAPAAVGYAGAGDVESLAAPRDLVSITDGDEVFGLHVIGTPGHTPGHISVLDPGSGLLVAGDAVVTNDGHLDGPVAEFTDDLDLAHESVKALATETVEAILVGHGDPITSGGAQQLRDLARSL